jgi:hypothetical protein
MATFQSTEKYTKETGDEKTSNPLPLSTHTVLAEVATTQWCESCHPWNNDIYTAYGSGAYDFEYVEMIMEDSSHNILNTEVRSGSQLYSYGIPGWPLTFFDGNYQQINGNDPDLLPGTITTCGNRVVADIDASLSVQWLGNGQLSFTLTIQNNGGSQYNGHIRVFITEIVSRYLTHGGANYHHGCLGFAFNKDISITTYGTYIDSTTWDGNDHSDSSGNDFGDITSDNILVILGVYNSNDGYIDETVATTPQTTQTNRSPTKPIITGVTNGSTNVSYTYTVVSTDLDDDTLQYTFDWGDSATNSSGFLPNGTSYTANHSWTTPGPHTITVTATDNKTQDYSTMIITIKAEEKKPSTPGFELVFVIGAIVVAMLLRRKKLV